MTALRRITSLDSWKRAVERTSPTLSDGSPNPNYEVAIMELEAATAHFDARMAAIDEARRQGFIRNRYAGTCSVTGESVPEAVGFARRDEVGKWRVYSWDAAMETAAVSVPGDLPELSV